MDHVTIPIVDLTPFRQRTAQSRHVVATISQACEEIGFFVITGHGVPDDVIVRMYATSRAFFDLPPDEKRTVHTTGEALGGLTYSPLLGESLAATRGEQTPSDLKETLDYGPGFYGDAWPANPPGLHAVWMAYYGAMSGLAAQLRRIFALALSLPETFFEDKFDRHTSSLRVPNYPAQDQAPVPGQLRAGAHSDYGFLTILRSEDAPGGLQALPRSGEWTAVPALPNAFVVNLGDALMRWTNDRWVSTVHRVVNPPGEVRQSSRRQSMAFFHNPNADASITCLEICRGPDNPPKYEPITYDAYARMKYRQATGKELK